MKNYLYLLAFLFASMFSCLQAKANTTLHVVHNANEDLFSINGFDLQYDGADKDHWIKLGDKLLIDDVYEEYLDGGGVRCILRLTSFEKNRTQVFKSRIMNPEKTILIAQAKEISRATQDPKWISGYHPEVVYQITLVDGSQYMLYTPYSDYHTDAEAQAVLATMVIEPGDSLTFNDLNPFYSRGKNRYDFFVKVNHEGLTREYRVEGPLREVYKPLIAENTFRVANAGVHHIYGIFPRSFDKVEFHEFLPGRICAVVKSDLTMEEIARKGKLEFVRTYPYCGGNVYVFKDDAFFFQKEVHVRPWSSPGF